MLGQIFAILTQPVNLFSISIGTLVSMTLGILKMYGDLIISINSEFSKARTGGLLLVSFLSAPYGVRIVPLKTGFSLKLS